MLAWGAVFILGVPAPQVAGGPLVWHAHEMIFGFGFAALIGFLLTAAPEFSNTPSIQRNSVVWLFVLWLVARLGYNIGGYGQWLTAIAEVLLIVLLILMITPQLWHDSEKRHLAFVWALLLMAGITFGFHFDALRGVYPMRWLLAATGVFMVLIVLAMSRISMRIINNELEYSGQTNTEYLSRPPRRNLAIFCISAYTLAELITANHPVSGWLALAAASALLNLTNDWHLGRVLFRRWVFMLYVIYWMIALGYLFIGISILTATGIVSTARHLMLIGGFGGAVFVVINIAGRIHSGLSLERRLWLPLAMGLLIFSALLRFLAYQPGFHFMFFFTAAIFSWVLSLILPMIFLAPVWLKPRSDGQEGCAGEATNPSQ